MASSKTLPLIGITRAAGRSLPDYGNIVDKIIGNSISVAVSALVTFLEFSRTLDTPFFEFFFVDLEKSKFSPRSISSAVSTFPEILTFSVKCSAK